MTVAAGGGEKCHHYQEFMSVCCITSLSACPQRLSKPRIQLFLRTMLVVR